MWDAPASNAGIEEIHLFRKNGDHTTVTDMDAFRTGAEQIATVSLGAVQYTDAQVASGTYTYGAFSYNSAGYGPGDLTDGAVEVQASGNTQKFLDLGLIAPTFDTSSGGTCEVSGGQEGTPQDPATLYCPDLDYGGFLQSTFYHDPYYHVTRFRSSVYDYAVLDDWYHVAFTRGSNDDTGTGAMYINGELISVGTLMDSIGTNGSLTIGALNASSWQPDQTFNGRIDQPAIWSRALSSEEMASIYNEGNGLAHNAWSDSLKQGSDFVGEFAEELGLGSDGTTEYGECTNLATGESFRQNIIETKEINGPSDSRPYTVAGGKVSPHAFTPCYFDELVYPLTGTNQEAINFCTEDAQNTQRIILSDVHMNNNDLGLGPWTLSAWISPHGLGYGYHQRLMLQDQNTRITYEGEEYFEDSGVIFSDYSGYSGGNAFANFRVAFTGLVKPSDIGL